MQRTSLPVQVALAWHGEAMVIHSLWLIISVGPWLAQRTVNVSVPVQVVYIAGHDATSPPDDTMSTQIGHRMRLLQPFGQKTGTNKITLSKKWTTCDMC